MEAQLGDILRARSLARIKLVLIKMSVNFKIIMTGFDTFETLWLLVQGVQNLCPPLPGPKVGRPQ